MPRAVREEEDRQKRPACRKVHHGNIGRIEQRNHEHGPEVIDNGQGRQKNFEGDGHALAQQGENAEHKGNIGRHGNAPPRDVRLVRIEGHKNQHRHEHPADGGRQR